MVGNIVAKYYGLDVLNFQQLSVGAGSITYLVETDQGKFILKNPARNEMNNPEIEPQLCEFLLTNGIPVSEFIKNRSDSYISQEGDEFFHLQKFVEGRSYYFNRAPEWLMIESARLLGKLHATLRDFPPLTTGIGESFFKNMTPQAALCSYTESVEIAREKGIRNQLRI